uniref:SERPIN domain-containing protein n=1 Tax=Panagrellus redivivus TaxID=6233 RepID=A0A7E4WDD2_PANRE
MGFCTAIRKKRPKPSRNSRIAKRSKRRSQSSEKPTTSKPKHKDPPIFTRKFKDKDQFLATTTPKPISRWLLWHMYVTHQSFNDEIFRTRTINKVFAPLAFLTHCVMLWHFSDGTTRKFLSKLLRVEGFYAIKSFEEDFQRYTSKFIYNEVSNDNMISMCNKLFITDKLVLKDGFKAATKAPANIQILTMESDKTGGFNQLHEAVLKELRKACGSKFAVGNPEKLVRAETKMLSIVGTCVRAAFDGETFKFKKAKFMCYYGVRQLEHPFFIVNGKFSHAVFSGFEAWSMPLTQRSPCDDPSKGSTLSLVLVRPENLGDILELEHMDNFDRIAKAIQVVSHREPKRGSLLLPFIDLPYHSEQHVTYGVTDLTVNWRSGFTPSVVSNLSKAAEPVSNIPPGLDKLFHCASIRIDASGITYQGSNDPVPEESNLPELSVENSLKLKPSKSTRHDPHSLSATTRSKRIQRMASENAILPEGIARKQRREKLQHFNGRFDSPFLFYVVDLRRSGILLSGCYGGRPALAASDFRKPANNIQLKHVPNSVKQKGKRCGVC